MVEWNGDYPSVTAPAEGRATLNRIGPDSLFPNETFPWGQVSSYKVDSLEASAHFRGAIATIDIDRHVDPTEYLAGGELTADDGVAVVRQQLADWRADFVDWVSLIAGQHVSPSMPAIPSRAQMEAEGTVVWLEDPELMPHVSYQSGRIRMTMNTDESSGFLLDNNILDNIETLMASGERPSSQLRLLRSARVAIRRGEQRVALIELGSALELCLWNLYDHPVARSSETNRTTWTLGTLLTKVYPSSDPMRQALHALVVKPRNAAIHQTIECDYATALKAFALVRGLVSNELPFPVVSQDDDPDL